MWRDFTIRILPPFLLYGAAGWWLGHKLVSVPHLQTYKLLNVVGAVFDLAGVILLSQFVASSQQFRRFISNTLAEQISAFFVSVGIGLILFFHFGHDGPSKPEFERIVYGMPVMLMVLVVPYFTVIFGEGKAIWSETVRATILGGFFLVGGILLHLIAGILDMYA